MPRVTGQPSCRSPRSTPGIVARSGSPATVATSLLHHVANREHRLERAVRRRAQHALARIAADVSRHASVGDGRPVVYHAPQVVAALRLYRGVAVAVGRRAGPKARPHAYHHGRHVARGAKVALCDNRVHHALRAQLRDACAVRVHEHGDRSRGGHASRLVRVRAQHAAHVLHRGLAQADGLAKAHGAPHGRGHGHVKHHHVRAAAVQPHGNARGKVSRAAYHYQHRSSKQKARRRPGPPPFPDSPHADCPQ